MLVLQVRVADDASVARLAARTVMVRRFVDLWASGDSWDTLAAAVRALSPEVYGEYLAEGTTFKVRVEANPNLSSSHSLSSSRNRSRSRSRSRSPNPNPNPDPNPGPDDVQGARGGEP